MIKPEEKNFYHTIEQTATAEFKDRGSRFISICFPVKSAVEFKTIYQQIKKEHPKAVHHCFAYRLGTGMDNFRSSDDGEPSGTAGKQILGQIDSRQLTNTLVIVVRYFGGTLLGVPGLINAYKTSASLVLQLVPAVQKAVEVSFNFQFEYSQLNDLLKILKKCNATVISQDLSLFPSLSASVPVSREAEMVSHLKDLHNITFARIMSS